MFDLFDIPKETTKKLVSAGKKFALELGVPVHEVQIRIEYAKDGNPHYKLYKTVDDGKGGSKWQKVRVAHLNEIV